MNKIIKDNDSYYKLLFENNPALQILLNRHSLEIINANKAARKFFWSVDYDSTGKSITDTFPQDTLLLIIEYIKNIDKAKSDNISINLRKGKEEFNFLLDINFAFPGQDTDLLLCFTNTTRHLCVYESKFRTTENNLSGYKHDITHNSSTIIFQLDKGGTILNAEGYGLDKIHLNNRLAVGSCIFEVYKHYPNVIYHVERALHGENILTSLELSGMLFDLIITSLKDTSGNIIGVVGFVTDITDRKRTEEALELSEAQYRTLVENTSDIMFSYNARGVFTYISNSVNRFGYQVDEIIGNNVMDFIYEEDRQYVYKEISNSLSGLEGKVPRIFRIKLKDNTYIVVEEVGKTILDGTGNVALITGILRDITQRKMAEDELRKSEERYRLLVELMPESVVILKQSKIVFANNSFLQLSDYTNHEEVLGLDIFEFFHNDTKSLKNIFMDILKKQLRFLTYESKIISSNQKTIDVEITGSFFIYSDSPSILLIIRDISVRKKNMELVEKIEQNNLLLREAQEYDKLKTEFFANISHEFRTPLSVIMATLQLLKLIMKKNNHSLMETEKFEHYFYTIKQNCYRLVRLVNNLIDITRIDSNFYAISLQNCNIVKIIESIVLSILEYVENKGLTINLVKMEDCIFTACDPDKIERIILNLISNAIKFNSEGGKITIKIKRAGKNVEISVADTGIGIPPDKLNIIFERFRQIDKSLTRNREGSGIGLSLVKSLVEMHDGNIHVESKCGNGSEFIINLPVRQVDSPESFEVNYDKMRDVQIEKIDMEFSDIYLK